MYTRRHGVIVCEDWCRALFGAFFVFEVDISLVSSILTNQKEANKLAVDLERSLNDLLEEAIRDVLKKHEKKPDQEII